MLNAIDPSLTNSGTDAASVLGDLDTDVFLQLLVAQLQHQNPLEPLDASGMLEQSSQFATVEAIQRMTEMQGHVMGFTQFGIATGMIGRYIEAIDPTLGVVGGIVTGVRATESGPVLEVGDLDIDLHTVTQVEEVSENPVQEGPTP